MLEEYAFEADIGDYHGVVRVWTAQEQLREHRRKSLEDEGEAALGRRKGQGITALFGKDMPYIKGQAIEMGNESPCTDGRVGSALQHYNYGGEAGDLLSLSLQPPPMSPTPSAPPTHTTNPLSPAVPQEPPTDSELGDLAALYLPIPDLADDHPGTSEEPPPYSADGWEWPDENADWELAGLRISYSVAT